MRKFNSPSSGVTGRYCTDLDVNGDVTTADGAVLEADNLHITAENADLTTNVKDLSGNVTGSISVTDKGSIAVTGTLTGGKHPGSRKWKYYCKWNHPCSQYIFKRCGKDHRNCKGHHGKSGCGNI